MNGLGRLRLSKVHHFSALGMSSTGSKVHHTSAASVILKVTLGGQSPWLHASFLGLQSPVCSYPRYRHLVYSFMGASVVTPTHQTSYRMSKTTKPFEIMRRLQSPEGFLILLLIQHV